LFDTSLTAGDEVLLSVWEYPSVRAAWFQRPEREGVRVVEVELKLRHTPPQLDRFVDALGQVVTSSR